MYINIASITFVDVSLESTNLPYDQFGKFSNSFHDFCNIFRECAPDNWYCYSNSSTVLLIYIQMIQKVVFVVFLPLFIAIIAGFVYVLKVEVRQRG